VPTTLVAVNGLGGTVNHWNRFDAALPADFRLRVLDLLGHGDRPPATDYRYGALVEDVAARTADLPPLPLIGWSVGGAVSWLFAARHRGRVTHLYRAGQIAEIAQGLPDVLVEQVPGAGHFMVRERPHYVADRVAAFVGAAGLR